VFKILPTDRISFTINYNCVPSTVKLGQLTSVNGWILE